MTQSFFLRLSLCFLYVVDSVTNYPEFSHNGWGCVNSVNKGVKVWFWSSLGQLQSVVLRGGLHGRPGGHAEVVGLHPEAPVPPQRDDLDDLPLDAVVAHRTDPGHAQLERQRQVLEVGVQGLQHERRHAWQQRQLLTFRRPRLVWHWFHYSLFE